MFHCNGVDYDVDKHGYLKDHTQWSEELALCFAAAEGIEMDAPHWEVVHFVRNFYLEYNTSPAIRALVKAMGQQLGPDKGNSKYLYKLFPKGPAKQATRIAGLPKPARCI